jgi:hypothetical protein
MYCTIKPIGNWFAMRPTNDFRRFPVPPHLGTIAWLAVLLTGCAADHTQYDAWTNQWGQPYSGPVAKPQVAYRIDDHRFFEVVPYQDMPCARARLYYTDTAKGIHANIAPWDQVSKGTFIIDASNDQYLVAPIIASSSGCQTGAGDKCASSLYYSENYGQTWKMTKPKLTLAGGAVRLIGDSVFHAGQRAKIPALASGDEAWKDYHLNGENELPIVIKTPVDNRLHCDSKEKE